MSSMETYSTPEPVGSDKVIGKQFNYSINALQCLADLKTFKEIFINGSAK